MGLLVLILSVFTLGFPWYFVLLKYPGSNCQNLVLYSWADQYCYSRGDCTPDMTCDTTKTNWQDDCTAAMNDQCSARKTTFNVALGLTAVSTFCALFVSLGFCIRCCSSNYKRRNPLHVVLTLVSLSSLVGALTYFAIQAPKTNGVWCLGTTACNTLWGENSATTTINWAWGTAGWVVGCVTVLFMLISLCMSCQRSSDEVDLGSYYSMGEHVEGVQPHTQRHSHSQNNGNYQYTSASTTYVG